MYPDEFHTAFFKFRAEKNFRRIRANRAWVEVREAIEELVGCNGTTGVFVAGFRENVPLTETDYVKPGDRLVVERRPLRLSKSLAKNVSSMYVGGVHVSHYVTNAARQAGDKPPDGYVCGRCRKSGHYAEACEAAQPTRRPLPHGLPMTFLRIASETERDQAYYKEGKYYVLNEVATDPTGVLASGGLKRTGKRPRQ